MIKIIEQLEEARLIPLKDYSKEPSVKWQNDTHYNLDKDIVTYGVDAERSGLVIIDCDNKHDGTDGVQNFLKVCMDEDDADSLNTLVVSTPNNGYHFYYKAPKNVIIKSSVGKVFGEGIDVRALGGYVVGPGSKVKNDKGEIAEYVISDKKAEIKELPEWSLKYFETYENSKNKSNNSDKNNNSDKPNKNEDEKFTAKEEIEQLLALDWALNRIEESTPGNRDVYLNSLSFFMGRKRVPEEKARKLIDIIVNKGWTQKQAESKFLHGYNDGLKQEVQEFDIIVKEFNSMVGNASMNDPNNTDYYTHFALAANFWSKNNKNLLYWQEDKQWYYYEEETGAWNSTDETTVKELMRVFLEELVEDVRAKNTKLSSTVYRAQEKLYTRTTLDSVTAVARTHFNIREKNVFNSEISLINCKNGVVNLKNGEITPHSPTYFMTKYIPIDYDPQVEDNYCNKVIDSINPSEKDYVQILAGQSLVGEQPISQSVFFLFGGGSNGKSTFIDLMLKTSGTYGKLMPPTILTPDNGKENYALADIEDLRTAIVEELPDSKQLNSGALKRLVGTQRINSRQIYAKARTFVNQATVFISCNRLPIVNETDHGTWRRLTVINFPYSYKRSPNEVIGPNDRVGDPMVLFSAQKSNNTAKAFLKWRVDGAIKWYTDQKLEYNIPNSITETTNEWNESNDLIKAWFNDTVDFKKGSFTLILDLHESYNDWASIRQHPKLSLRTFSELIRGHDIFISNNFRLDFKRKGYINKDLTPSYYVNENTIKNNNHDLSKRPSFVEGLCFR